MNKNAIAFLIINLIVEELINDKNYPPSFGLRIGNSCFQNLIRSFLSQILYSFLLSNYFLNINRHCLLKELCGCSA